LAGLAAAVVDRRSLSLTIYPPVDGAVPGASAVVNAMAGRFPGATLFGSPGTLPRCIPRSAIRIRATSPGGRECLAEVERAMRLRAPRVGDVPQILARFFDLIAERPDAGARAAAEGASSSTYERMLDVRPLRAGATSAPADHAPKRSPEP
jgi:hypothetical protein